MEYEINWLSRRLAVRTGERILGLASKRTGSSGSCLFSPPAPFPFLDSPSATWSRHPTALAAERVPSCPMIESIAYHLVPEPWYRTQPANGPYVPEPFEREGFVHLTHGIEPVMIVGNTFYRDDPRPYLVLTVDLRRVVAEVRYEDPDNQYPHIYGPIDREAILTVRRVVRDERGAFLGVTPAEEWGDQG